MFIAPNDTIFDWLVPVRMIVISSTASNDELVDAPTGIQLVDGMGPEGIMIISSVNWKSSPAGEKHVGSGVHIERQ